MKNTIRENTPVPQDLWETQPWPCHHVKTDFLSKRSTNYVIFPLSIIVFKFAYFPVQKMLKNLVWKVGEKKTIVNQVCNKTFWPNIVARNNVNSHVTTTYWFKKFYQNFYFWWFLFFVDFWTIYRLLATKFIFN